MSRHSAARRIGFVTCAEHRDLFEDDLILAAALERRGAEVIPVIWTEKAPQATDCHLLLLRSCWDYHLKPKAFLKWVTDADAHSPVINSSTIVRWNMDKRYLRDIEQQGFAVPKTFMLTEGSRVDLAQIMSAAGFERAVVKPTISLSAYETHVVFAAEAEQFSAKLNFLMQSRDMLVQEFVPEISTEGEWSLVFLGGQFSHAVQKFPKTGDFRVQHEYGGSALVARPSDLMLKTTAAILSRFAPLALYCRADVVPRSQGVTLMELELIDPLLHFELALEAADRMADVLLAFSLDPGCNF
jgi:Prokaryotic glutathione synthetase, ATP-grasp domain